MEQFRFMAAANGQGGGGAPFKPRTVSGVPYDECISGIQKMIRRGKEKEALILAPELCASGYPAAVARRLMIIACEDIGLAIGLKLKNGEAKGRAKFNRIKW